MKRRTWKLDSGRHVIKLVPGPHPYLWIGDYVGCFDTLDKKQLRSLRDALTKALRGAK
jgi:hypothetical protein